MTQPSVPFPPDLTLPFDPAPIPAAAPPVFGHYVPWMPPKLDNASPPADAWETAYRSPSGEGGKHKAYGGYTRDRPWPLPGGNPATWRQDVIDYDVAMAQKAGMTGLAVDLVSLTPATSSQESIKNITRLMDAGHRLGMPMMLMPDLAGSLAALSPIDFANRLAALAKASPAAWRLDSGELVVAPFKADAHPDAAWWTQMLAVLNKSTPAVLIPVPLSATTTLIKMFGTIGSVYAMGEWGNRTPDDNKPEVEAAKVAAVRAAGMRWMAPISVQDERPYRQVFREALATANLRTTWLNAIAVRADLAMLVTMNDYAEGTQFGYSQQHGTRYLEVSRYYQELFQTDRRPELKRDAIYLTHRRHSVAAVPTAETAPMKNVGGSRPADVVEALVFATAPGEVSINGSTYPAVDAGVAALSAVPDWAAERQSASLVRHGRTVVAVDSDWTTTTAPAIQDLGYAVSSAQATPPPPVSDRELVDAAGAYGTAVDAFERAIEDHRAALVAYDETFRRWAADRGLDLPM